MRVGITGHHGLSRRIVAQVQELLAERLRRHDPRSLTVVTCAGDGPESLFAKAALDAGAAVEVVVPAPDFRGTLPAEHLSDHDDLLRRARAVHRTGLPSVTPQARQAAGEILVGLSDELLAVWDGLPARGEGGTADTVAYALGVHVPVTVLWPEGAAR
ncbi:hypothetical protein [Streptomyces sp. MJP52]|uniref:hypothetical protein n=1 Tax=Streptomyces sp. MJP52 TaxID=2940555 RepID=UPI0024751141|nr:hypothetical protein [Streptomyces sp. MJP52]MDH6228523.1 hypothetical protein [Streptomyces sp. MJP52]